MPNAFPFAGLFERHCIDTFWRPREWRCMITAGNGINGDCTVENLVAFLDEAYAYGAKAAKPQAART